MEKHQTASEWQTMASDLGVSDNIQQKLDDVLGALETHHAPTANHCRRVGMLAVRIGQVAGLPLRPLFYGGSLHDRGKRQVARHLLDKTTEWTTADAAALHNHPLVGYQETLKHGMIVTAGLIVRHHTFQPNSYPENLPDQPPYMTASFAACARTIALADYYDAAHRNDSEGGLSGEQIRQKVEQHNQDLTTTIDELYEKGIFTV